MSKHKRLKAARRKQHNTTAKERDRQWKADCLSRREQYLLDAQRRELEGCNVKVAPPKSKDTIEQILDGVLSGNAITSAYGFGLASVLPQLWGPGGLNIYELANRRLPTIDTEGFTSDACSLKLSEDGVFDAFCEPGIPMARKPIKVGDPDEPHTEQCMARHTARCDEAARVEADMIAKGEEALAVYLHPTFMICTCDEPENEEHDAS